MKLSDDKVREIREELQKPKVQQKPAKEWAYELGTTATTIYRIRNNNRRRDLVCPWCLRRVKHGQLRSV